MKYSQQFCLCVCVRKRSSMWLFFFFVSLSFSLPFYRTIGNVQDYSRQQTSRRHIQTLNVWYYLWASHKKSTLSLSSSRTVALFPSLLLCLSLGLYCRHEISHTAENKNKLCITETHFRQRPSITMYQKRTSAVRACATNTQNCECITQNRRIFCKMIMLVYDFNQITRIIYYRIKLPFINFSSKWVKRSTLFSLSLLSSGSLFAVFLFLFLINKKAKRTNEWANEKANDSLRECAPILSRLKAFIIGLTCHQIDW